MASLNSALVFLKNPTKDAYDKPGWNSEHLGICYLGAALRQAGFPVTLIDGAAEGFSSEEVLERIILLNTDFVGFSVTHATIKDALDISRQFKAESPETHICFGGHHATLSAQQILENEDCVDSVVRGDGEVTIVELLKALQAGASLEGMSGLYYRNRHGEVCANKDRPIVPNLDMLSFPLRDVLEIGIAKGVSDSAIICSSRGCPWKCRFCSTPEYYKLQGGAYWRARSAVSVVDEIQSLYEEYGCKMFAFVDDNFVIQTRRSKDRVREIANQILQRNLDISWDMICSVAAFGEEDEQLLGLLKASGLTWIFLGIEAGCQPTLNAYDKPVSPEQNLRAVDFLAEFGILVVCGMILFHPYATRHELVENSRFIKRLMDKPSVGMFAPYCKRLEAYPGIPIFKDVERDGLLPTNKPYLNVHSYKFVSPVVQLVADTMWQLLPLVVDTDWLIWDARLLLSRAINKESQRKGESSVLDQARTAIQRTIEEINRIKFDFFTVALEVADKDDRAALDRAKAEYVQRLKEQDALLRQKHQSLTNKIGCSGRAPSDPSLGGAS